MKLLRFLTNLFQKQRPTEDELDMACYFALEGELMTHPDWYGLPSYPEGNVTGPCVCGSWPGGECLKCKVQFA